VQAATDVLAVDVVKIPVGHAVQVAEFAAE